MRSASKAYWAQFDDMRRTFVVLYMQVESALSDRHAHGPGAAPSMPWSTEDRHRHAHDVAGRT